VPESSFREGARARGRCQSLLSPDGAIRAIRISDQLRGGATAFQGGPWGIGIKRRQRDKMAARDSRKDCWLRSPLALRERGLGVRVQSLLNLDSEIKDIPSLTLALSRRERVVYTSRARLTPMGARGLG